MGPGLKTGVVVGPRNSEDRGAKHRIEGIILEISIQLYATLSISEKSPILESVLFSYSCTL